MNTFTGELERTMVILCIIICDIVLDMEYCIISNPMCCDPVMDGGREKGRKKRKT